ncbi:MAG: hypothetical protein ACI4S3_07260 [Candidatus Gastranaerophilaceae bacterium]
MIVYLYDKKTGVYLSEYSPQVNPKNPTEFLFPKNSTLIKPIVKNGFVPVFDGKKWVQTPDYRGKEVINTDTKQVSVVKKIGSLPENNILYETYKLTKEFQEQEQEKEIENKKNEILVKLNELDLKRIRAVCEPEIHESGKSWLEFYNEQICELRTQLKEL